MLAINNELFEATSHSPALVDLVGYEAAAQVIDFCFIANPYYPTPAMVDELVRQLPVLIKRYPSSNPLVSARHLAAVLHVDAEHLIVGNGATELITELCHRLVPTMGVPIPTFGEYIEKIDPARLQFYPLQAASNYQLDLTAYLAWLHDSSPARRPGDQPPQSHRPTLFAGRDAHLPGRRARSRPGDRG